MSDTVIQIENVSKQYRLGQVGSGTVSRDLQAWFAKIRGKENPNSKIITENKLNIINGDIVWALKDINFEIKQGEILGIIGKNGAGKSTLLKLLSRVTTPTTGSINVKGRIASLLEVGTGFHPELTGKENIFLNGAILGMTKSEIKSKFDEIVDFSGVEKYIDTPVKRYSSGMYVRLAFAVAAHLESEILIIDEVLAVGDAEFQKKCLGKMEGASKEQGRTVLFVSHNMAAVKQLCKQGIILRNGTLDFTGSSEDAIQNYLLKFAQEEKITHQKYNINNCPTGEIVELLEYSLLNSNGQIISKFNLYEEVKVEMVFRVKQKGFSAFPNLHFFNQEDQYVFVASTSYDSDISLEGIYKTTFIINANTFNTGIFKVGIAITCYPGTSVQFFVNPAITFEVEESNVELRRYPYTGILPGEFRPKISNNTMKI